MDIVLGLDSWIIQDENYDDFKVGEDYSFALEFYPHSVEKSDLQKSISRLERAEYQITCEIVYLDRDSWVIDFGLLAYQDQRPPKGFKVGDMVSGRFYIGVDHFAYFERLKYVKGFPELTYNWQLESIELETTPFIETAPKLLERDKSKESFEKIEKTDAWQDANGLGSYLFSCKVQES